MPGKKEKEAQPADVVLTHATEGEWTVAIVAPEAERVEPAPEPAPVRRVQLYEGQHNAPATVLSENEDGTLNLSCELWPGRVLSLTGVHRRNGAGNGWEEV